MKNGDMASGAVLAALGSFIVVQALQWEYLGPDGPGPGFFPFWYGVLIIVLSLGLAAAAVIRKRPEKGSRVHWGEVGRALAIWAAFALSAALLPLLGFLASFALLTVFVVRAMYGRSLTEAFAAGVVGAALFYIVFPVALEVTLPIGKLGF